MLMYAEDDGQLTGLVDAAKESLNRLEQYPQTSGLT